MQGTQKIRRLLAESGLGLAVGVLQGKRFGQGSDNRQKVCFPASGLQALCLPALPTLSTTAELLFS